MSKELNRMQKLAGVPAKKETESLNEHYMAGGIVGVGAINHPKREKSDYEMAFEYFMNEGEEKGEDFINPGNTEDDQAKKDAYDYDARPAHMKEGEDSTYEEDDTMEEAVGIDASAEAIRGEVRKMVKRHSNDADLGAAVRAKFA